MTTTIQQHGDITTATRQGRNGVKEYFAFGKRGGFALSPDSDLFAFLEPGDLHFEFGDTPDEALSRLLKSMGAAQ